MNLHSAPLPVWTAHLKEPNRYKNRKLVRDVLTFKGYTTIEAETGEAGVRLAQERHPSLVLMDIRLPGIDGVEALRRLRAEETTRAILVMAMTASVMSEGPAEDHGRRVRRVPGQADRGQ
jgi:CheY-like chemotaxis protein